MLLLFVADYVCVHRRGILRGRGNRFGFLLLPYIYAYGPRAYMTKRQNRANNLTTFGGCRIIMYLSYEWTLSLTAGALYIVLRKIWNDGKLAIRKSRARIQDDVYERQEKKQIKQYDNGDDDEDD